MDNANNIESLSQHNTTNIIQSKLTNSLSLLMIESESLLAKSKSLDLEINTHTVNFNEINIQQNISNTIIARLLEEINFLKNKKDMLMNNFNN